VGPAILLLYEEALDLFLLLRREERGFRERIGKGHKGIVLLAVIDKRRSGGI